MRLLAYCLMPNCFHVLLWPGEDGDSSRFMSWLTMTHTQRWMRTTERPAPVISIRVGSKSFPRAIGRAFPHGVPLCRAERLACQLGGRGEDGGGAASAFLGPRMMRYRPALTPWPIDRPRDWTDRVNRSFGPQKEEEAVRRSIQLLGGVWRVIGGGTKEEEAVRLEGVQQDERTVRRPGRRSCKPTGVGVGVPPPGRPRKEPQNGS